MIKYLTQIPNINGELIPDLVGGNAYLFVDDADNTSFIVNRYSELQDGKPYYTYKSGTANHKAISDYLLQIEKKNEGLNSNSSTFEQFNNILQTTALLAVAGGAIYYFFFYDKKKGKKK